MKPYTVSVDINKPRGEVISLFDNADNLFHWQTGLQRYEHLSGEPGQVGAKAKLIFQHGNQVIELIETITHRDLPDRFDGHYQWGGGQNTLQNQFIQLGGNMTRWESTCSYEFKTLSMKLIGFFMPGKFKEQNQLFLENFKAFCETGASVRCT